ncbi:hypothetical protein ABZ951_03595 [Streptomyces sp. NPDC046215]|uniref:Uncharacterized protein n=1 Tax=Streptomyces stramineus TaxID=173861 RepID=A0ABP3JCT6_9ACTN
MLVDHLDVPDLPPAAYREEEAPDVATDSPAERAWLPSYQAALTA